MSEEQEERMAGVVQTSKLPTQPGVDGGNNAPPPPSGGGNPAPPPPQEYLDNLPPRDEKPKNPAPPPPPEYLEGLPPREESDQKAPLPPVDLSEGEVDQPVAEASSSEPVTAAPPPPPPPPPASTPAVEKDKDAEQAKGTGLSSKFAKVDLLAKDPSLLKLRVGLGWDAVDTEEGPDFDLDASLFLLNQEGKVRRDTDFVFYNNPAIENDNVVHLGDNENGVGEGDDEVMELNLEKIPFEVERIAIAVSIHNADERGQSFAFVKNAYIRLMNIDTNEEIYRADLTIEQPDAYGCVIGYLLRDIGSGWFFQPDSKAGEKGLYSIALGYGVNVAEP